MFQQREPADGARAFLGWIELFFSGHMSCLAEVVFMPFPEDPKSRRGWVVMSEEALTLASTLELWAVERDDAPLLADLRAGSQARTLAVHARFLSSALSRVEMGAASPREGTELVAELSDLRVRARQLVGTLGRESDPPASPRGTIPDVG